MFEWFMSLPSVLQGVAYAAVGMIAFYFATRHYNDSKGSPWRAFGTLAGGILLGLGILAYFALPGVVNGAVQYVDDNGQQVVVPAREGYMPPAAGDAAAPGMGE